MLTGDISYGICQITRDEFWGVPAVWRRGFCRFRDQKILDADVSMLRDVSREV
jgi:hypothetical protein